MNVGLYVPFREFVFVVASSAVLSAMFLFMKYKYKYARSTVRFPTVYPVPTETPYLSESGTLVSK